MRNRPDHRDAVARRLDLLRAELDSDAAPTVEDEPWWETAPVLELVPPTVDDPGPPAVPVPGRHAARRHVSPTRVLRERASAAVPETLRGGAGVGPWHLTVLALLVAAALAVTCWWLLRGDPKVTPVAGGPATPLVAVSGGASAPAGSTNAGPVPAGSTNATSGAAAATPASATVTVDVTGKVRHPGVLDLPTGSRVVDAIAAAGGARRGADLSSLNRARVLVDGEQIVVGAPGRGGASAAGSALGATGATGAAGATAGTPETLVDLNTATLEELDTLPGVGPVTAQTILDYRTQHGGFGSVDELLDVQGIGEATLSKIAPHVTV